MQRMSITPIVATGNVLSTGMTTEVDEMDVEFFRAFFEGKDIDNTPIKVQTGPC